MYIRETAKAEANIFLYEILQKSEALHQRSASDFMYCASLGIRPFNHHFYGKSLYICTRGNALPDQSPYGSRKKTHTI